MIKWIKDWFNYRAKYEALLREQSDAARNAIFVMGQYDALCATLPKDHPQATTFQWERYADDRLMREHWELKRKYEKMRKVNNEMLSLWQDALVKYAEPSSDPHAVPPEIEDLAAKLRDAE